MSAAVKSYLEPSGERFGAQSSNLAVELALNLVDNAGSSDQKAILDALPVLVFLEEEGKITFANREARQVLDTDNGEWAARPIEEVLWGLLPGTAEPQTRLKGTRRSRPFHATMPAADGRMMPVEGTYSVLGESRNEAVIVAWPGAHERAPKTTFMEDVLASLPEAVAIEHGTHILYANPAFTRMFGYSADEIGGCGMSEMMMSDANLRENAALAKLLEEQGSGNADAVLRSKRGTMVHVNLEVAPLVVDGQHAGRVFTFREAVRQDGTGSWQLVENLESHWGASVVPFP